MKEEELARIREVLRTRGDDFWNDRKLDEQDRALGIEGNSVLINEIVEILNEAGLDLVLVDNNAGPDAADVILGDDGEVYTLSKTINGCVETYAYCTGDFARFSIPGLHAIGVVWTMVPNPGV